MEVKVKVGKEYAVSGVDDKEPTVENAIDESDFLLEEGDKILLNGQPAEKDDTVKDGDEIMIVAASAEEEATEPEVVAEPEEATKAEEPAEEAKAEESTGD